MHRATSEACLALNGILPCDRPSVCPFFESSCVSFAHTARSDRRTPRKSLPRAKRFEHVGPRRLRACNADSADAAFPAKFMGTPGPSCVSGVCGRLQSRGAQGVDPADMSQGVAPCDRGGLALRRGAGLSAPTPPPPRAGVSDARARALSLEKCGVGLARQQPPLPRTARPSCLTALLLKWA